MLVLSRQKDESIIVGDTHVLVKEIQGDQVTLLTTNSVSNEMVSHTLHKNESCKPGDDSTIVVVEIRRINHTTKVRLGVEAPKEVPVHRKEIWDAIRRNEEAANEKHS